MAGWLYDKKLGRDDRPTTLSARFLLLFSLTMLCVAGPCGGRLRSLLMIASDLSWTPGEADRPFGRTVTRLSRHHHQVDGFRHDRSLLCTRESGVWARSAASSQQLSVLPWCFRVSRFRLIPLLRRHPPSPPQSPLPPRFRSLAPIPSLFVGQT